MEGATGVRWNDAAVTMVLLKKKDPTFRIGVSQEVNAGKVLFKVDLLTYSDYCEYTEVNSGFRPERSTVRIYGIYI